jgi:hypothetical protein
MNFDKYELPEGTNFCSKQVNPIETYGNQRVKWEKELQESKLRFWHRDCWFPCSPIKCQFYMYIPILQVSICRLFPCQLWSPLPLLVLSLHFRMPLFSASGGLHWICPNHLSRCWTNFYLIAATCTISHITSFLIRSFLVWLHIHLTCVSLWHSFGGCVFRWANIILSIENNGSKYT